MEDQASPTVFSHLENDAVEHDNVFGQTSQAAKTARGRGRVPCNGSSEKRKQQVRTLRGRGTRRDMEPEMRDCRTFAGGDENELEEVVQICQIDPNLGSRRRQK